ncbi:MAG: D-glycero-beta-D-manno-heptose 1-phosphate adenylyltransferase [Phycisphaeraceae bacterium]|nr:D-glycero-beta-D-manno-heptose 1-phosphate adenylyltransferase [Phycisphaeraceae bacterium]MCW5762300.1 D-glycero-beta-D-manno-heptose 1-phosphate adenylyltransferase [Phycisphaeraceae bacterium]
MDRLLEHLAAWKPFTAVVVGDFMLDQLLFGDAERLSSDAPVPVLQVRRQENMPGGAANLCMDLAAMKGRVYALGVVGLDPEGQVLRREMDTRGIDTTGLIADASRPTTIKRNLIGLAQARHPQKMFRVDFESREPIALSISDAILARLDAILSEADIVCIEDYGKGVCTDALCQEVIRRSRARGREVLVDPCISTDFVRYRGATAITPNRTEAERATGLKTHEHADAEHNAALARGLLARLELDAVVLTLDRHGALLLERTTDEPLPVPTIARDVYDVTGAGDMMLAGLAASRANGLDWPSAVRLANAAAGLEVQVFGVKPIPIERIHHEILEQQALRLGKLRSLEQIQVQVRAVREDGGSVAFTNGCFDVIHAGHVRLLEQASQTASLLIIGLNSDASVQRLKGPERPINGEQDRARVLGSISGVGSIVLFDEDTPMGLIEAIRPDVLIKGADYQEHQVVGADLVKSYGGRVHLIELVAGKSTTSTIERMRKPLGP